MGHSEWRPTQLSNRKAVSLFHITHLDGDMEDGDLGMLADLLNEVESADREHTDVSVGFETYALSIFKSGYLALVDIERRNSVPKHCYASRENQLIAAVCVALGQFDALDFLEWTEGY